MNLHDVKDDVKKKIGAKPKTMEKSLKKKLITGALVAFVAVGSMAAMTEKADAYGRKEVVRKDFKRVEIYLPSELCLEFAKSFERDAIAEGAYATSNSVAWFVSNHPAVRATGIVFSAGTLINRSIASKLREGANNSGIVVYGIDCGKNGILPYKIKRQ